MQHLSKNWPRFLQVKIQVGGFLLLIPKIYTLPLLLRRNGYLGLKSFPVPAELFQTTNQEELTIKLKMSHSHSGCPVHEGQNEGAVDEEDD